MTEEDKQLRICNLVSNGMPLAEANRFVNVSNGKQANTKEKPPEPTAKEKKAAIAKEIEALGGEVPAKNASVAKFEEALTAAKAAAEEKTEDLI